MSGGTAGERKQRKPPNWSADMMTANAGSPDSELGTSGLHAGTGDGVNLVPPLVVRGPGGTVTLRPGQVHLIGRDPEADVVVDAPVVSWQHAQLLVVAGHWLIQDAGSTNGTFCGGQRVRRMQLTGAVQVRLGHPDDGPLLSCEASGARPGAPDGAGPALAAHPATALWSSHATGGRPPTGITPVLDRVLRIGRADDNDVVVKDLRVSRRHAELRSLGDGRFQLTDTGSNN